MNRIYFTIEWAKRRGASSKSACLAARIFKIISRPDGRLAGRGPSLFFATKRARHISVDFNLESHRKCLALFCRDSQRLPVPLAPSGTPLMETDSAPLRFSQKNCKKDLK